ncbi:hypothetical protein V1477_020116 [Vespula maculifrons]|uniref:Uncharacterized protein n=1 Tax=Vespula maculifrons TaxID=7453 RepID=A0ABD2ALM1_VESMC
MKVGYREINGKVEIAKEEVEDLLNDVRLKWRWRGTEKEIMDEERKSRNMGKWEASRRYGGRAMRFKAEGGRRVRTGGSRGWNKGGFGSGYTGREWQTGPMCVCTPAENNVHTEALMRFKNNGDYLHYSLGISAVVALIPTAHGCVPGLLCVTSIQQQDTGILEHDETFDIDGKSRQGVRRSEVGGRGSEVGIGGEYIQHPRSSSSKTRRTRL